MNSKDLPDLNLKTGKKVFVRPLNKFGVILEGPDKNQRYQIGLGNLTCWIPKQDLALQEDKKSNPKKEVIRRRKSPTALIGDKSVTIDLHGYTTRAAVEEIEKTINTALLSQISRLEIIHGLGTGAVKQAVHDYLSRSHSISSFKLDTKNKGVTIVYL